MIISDLILSVVCVVVCAAVLFLNEDKIQKWADSKRGRKLGWRN